MLDLTIKITVVILSNTKRWPNVVLTFDIGPASQQLILHYTNSDSSQCIYWAHWMYSIWQTNICPFISTKAQFARVKLCKYLRKCISVQVLTQVLRKCASEQWLAQVGKYLHTYARVHKSLSTCAIAHLRKHLHTCKSTCTLLHFCKYLSKKLYKYLRKCTSKQALVQVLAQVPAQVHKCASECACASMQMCKYLCKYARVHKCVCICASAHCHNYLRTSTLTHSCKYLSKKLHKYLRKCTNV